jgi:t-SNARE complex subunit (syntaxin)
MRAESEIRAREKAAVESAKTKNKIRMFIILGILFIIVMVVAGVLAYMNGGSFQMDSTFNFHFGA